MKAMDRVLFYMKKIMVTGGAGFIGSHTAVVLHESGYEAVIVDNFKNSDPSVIKGIEAICQQKITVHVGDCADQAFLAGVFEVEKNISGVIHFAAYKAVHESNQFPLMYYRNNIGSLLTLLDVMFDHKVSNLVFSSSCTVYGSPDMAPVTEDAPIKDTPSTYGKTKQLSRPTNSLLGSIGSGSHTSSPAIAIIPPFNAITRSLTQAWVILNLVRIPVMMAPAGIPEAVMLEDTAGYEVGTGGMFGPSGMFTLIAPEANEAE